MAIRYAASGEIVSVRPLGVPLDDSQSTLLLRDGQFNVTRLVVPTGKRRSDQPGFAWGRAARSARCAVSARRESLGAGRCETRGKVN